MSLARPSQARARDLVVVINPGAGKYAGAKDYLPRLRAFADDQGRRIEVRGVEEQRRQLQRFRMERPSLVAILGGDGTIGCVLNDLVDLYGERNLPAILPLPGGTMNVLARDLGLIGNPADLLEEAHSEMVSASPVRFLERGLLRIALTPAPSLFEKPRYGFIFTNGGTYALIEEYQKHASRGQFFRTMVTGLLNANLRRRLAPAEMGFQFGDEPVEKRTVFGTLVSSVGRFMFGIQPFGGPLSGPDKMGVLAPAYTAFQAALHTPQLLWPLPRRLLGLNAKRVLCRETSGPLAIVSPSGITIDGDLFPQTRHERVQISVIAAAIRVPRLALGSRSAV